MPKQLTKFGALQVSHDLDRLAALYQEEAEAIGVSTKIANDFALRCDILSDHIEKRARIARDAEGALQDPDLLRYAAALTKRAEMDPKENYTVDQLGANDFNPAEIGEEQSGALLRNQDEPYMDVFKQDEFDQLRQVQQDGMFSNAKSASLLVQKMAKLLEKHSIPLPVVQATKAAG
jgi:hypothetical protein